MPNENYEGFDLTIYNLFTLLREMYYTRGETETNFLAKSGGTLGGSLTIQGNLTVQGNSYKIDTEDLVVKDYTITLAKDNNSALLSMVGMVVPKYDGTNYGFFGWDADGYAYVGDLTDYDGTSNITLANNSSLQKIATIKDTATGTTSDDIMVYDQTNKVFKKAPSGRYVIEDNELVASNDNNALYNLGAYDTISGNTITRQTGVVDLGSLEWTYHSGAGCWYTENVIPNQTECVSNNYTCYNQKSYSQLSNGELTTDNNGWGAIPTIIIKDTTGTNYPSGILQYKLATSYTEQVIENTPLLDLDQAGCNFLRNEWEKGLNLFNKATETVGQGILVGDGNTYIENDRNCSDYIEIEPNTAYSNNIVGNFSSGLGIAFYNSSKTFISGASIPSNIDAFNSFTTPSTAKYLRLTYAPSTTPNVILNRGTHAYPYEAYNGEIVHKADIEPVLLWENSSPDSAMASGGITTQDMSKYKYIEIVYKYSATSAYSKCVFKTVYEASTTFFISSANAQQYGELIVSRGFTFTNSTTLTADKGTKISIGSSSPTDDNNKIVPLAIYGTNVL